MNILEVRQLTKTYTIENRQITILDKYLCINLLTFYVGWAEAERYPPAC
ncbi:Uncharacterized protein dnl_33310 [Desulfonema limicola]|uniref:Uncharacterized protein n=1 Tax=Desulfonema limicola TaxID=45656 RepID=A0A975B910_9BACT|nr:Uncharacterized protein dnl_33310 [Desulfonema limicola]